MVGLFLGDARRLLDIAGQKLLGGWISLRRQAHRFNERTHGLARVLVVVHHEDSRITIHDCAFQTLHAYTR